MEPSLVHTDPQIKSFVINLLGLIPEQCIQVSNVVQGSNKAWHILCHITSLFEAHLQYNINVIETIRREPR